MSDQSMRIKSARAVQAGFAGAILMTVLMWLVRTTTGMPANLEMMLGTFFGLSVGMTAWGLGFFIHLVAGCVWGLLYAWCFENVSHQAGWKIGLGFGAVHTVVSGLFLGVIPAMHPLIPEQMAAPGMFMAGLGAAGVTVFAVLHLMFGAIMGAAYGRVLQYRSEEAAHGEPRHAH